MEVTQSVATGGKGLLRHEKFLFNLQLLHVDLVNMLPVQQGGVKSCVHHHKIQFPGCKQKISPTVRAARLSLAAVTASQVVEVRRDLWRSSRPTSLLKKGHLELVAHDCVQRTFEYLQG